MTRAKFPIIFLLTGSLLSGCASYHIRQGDRLYKDLAYSMAVDEYQKGLSKKENAGARVKLAESFYKMNNLQKAEEEYAKVVQQADASPTSKLRYAQLLMRSGKYVMAKSYFELYLASNPSDQGVKQLKQSCDSLQNWQRDSMQYTIQLSTLNSGQSNFSPVWYKDGIAFASDRNTKAKSYEWTGRPFLEMYYAKGDLEKGFSSPIAMGGINGIYHDGPASFSPKGDTMFFTRNNYVKKKAEKSSADIVDLKIYQAVKKDTSWSGITELPFNSKEYSTGHPSLTSDGNTMYFVSDKPGGQGGTDIYMSKRVNGTWSEAVNLGTTINTPFNEMFPTIWKDSVLYFSSDGHFNMGGLDIFKSEIEGAGWTEPRNMGYPLNTSYDDFGIALNESGTAGILSSNRNAKNTMQDNLYTFTINDIRFTLEGIAVDKGTQEPIAGVTVELTNTITNQKESVMTGPDGKFKFKLNPETPYSVVGNRDSYFSNTETVSTIGKRQSENMFVKLKLEMEKIIVNKPIVLQNIYYDLDKWDIRPDAAVELDHLVQVMNDNPNIRIELSSHTDSRADDHYNDVLSQKRAEAAVEYIVAHGVKSDRITAKGYGERQLINQCANKVECTEEQHQANRRTEFKVVSVDPTPAVQ